MEFRLLRASGRQPADGHRVRPAAISGMIRPFFTMRSTGTWSIDQPSSRKWTGASMWVPICPRISSRLNMGWPISGASAVSSPWALIRSSWDPVQLALAHRRQHDAARRVLGVELEAGDARHLAVDRQRKNRRFAFDVLPIHRRGLGASLIAAQPNDLPSLYNRGLVARFARKLALDAMVASPDDPFDPAHRVRQERYRWRTLHARI